MKILMTGGSGLLGSEIKKIDPSIIAPSRSYLDVTLPHTIDAAIRSHVPNCILHLAAKTKPPLHDELPEIGITNNIIGTANVALACLKYGIRMVYISSDYVYAGKGPHKETDQLLPPSKFIWSKLGGEASVQMIPKSLIIRCSFGPRPFPHERVYDNQQNSKMYVDEIAPLILKATQSDIDGVLNIGSDGQQLFSYAWKTKPDIEVIKTPAWVPPDTRLDTKKWKSHFSI